MRMQRRYYIIVGLMPMVHVATTWICVEVEVGEYVVEVTSTLATEYTLISKAEKLPATSF